jgi:hypothetical protein
MEILIILLQILFYVITENNLGIVAENQKRIERRLIDINNQLKQ